MEEPEQQGMEEHQLYAGWSEKDPPCPAGFRDDLRECKVLWRAFFDKYKELHAIPDFVDEWVAWQYRTDEPALWTEMSAVCGFDKPRPSDVVHGKCRVWKYQAVKLPTGFSCWYYDALMHVDGALLSPAEVRGIPGLNHEGEEWQHYMTTDVRESVMRRIITLRCRVSTCAPRGASRMCKMKWGPHGL